MSSTDLSMVIQGGGVVDLSEVNIYSVYGQSGG